MGRYFGTDGFRGEYGRELCDRHAELIGRILGEFYGKGFVENEQKDAKKREKIYGGKEKIESEKGALAKGKSETRGARILIGRDTRASSELLEAALIRGIRAAGGEAFSLGVCTTPAVAFSVANCRAYFEDKGEKFTANAADFAIGAESSADWADFAIGAESSDAIDFTADAAVMITASHNPWRDNGIKIFDRCGQKISEEITAKIENFIDENFQSAPNEPIDKRKETRDVFCKEKPEIISSGAYEKGADFAALELEMAACGKEGKKCGNFSIKSSKNSADFAAGKMGIYEEHLRSFGADFSGLRIGLDCANGAAFAIAPRVFRALGAEVFTIGTEPDGENINRGVGSTNISALREFVRENKLDMGFAFDGDGDRCISVNRAGDVLDGDCEMLNLALDLLSRGALFGGKIALTVMSNQGLVRELERHGIGCEICPVGDRFVAEKMRELGLCLGGEQSGHIIIGSEVTGDGILTAICLARIFTERGFLQNFTPLPQVSENVSVRDKELVMGDERLGLLLSEMKNELGGDGRILLRPSGTENLIRIMIEHQNPEKCKLMVSKIADLVRKIDLEKFL